MKLKSRALFAGNGAEFATIKNLVSKSRTIVDVDFLEADDLLKNQGVPAAKIKEYDVVIYDTDCFSYNVMLDNMYSLDIHKTLLATYNRESRTIITELEVIVL